MKIHKKIEKQYVRCYSESEINCRSPGSIQPKKWKNLFFIFLENRTHIRIIFSQKFSEKIQRKSYRRINTIESLFLSTKNFLTWICEENSTHINLTK